MRTRAQGTFEYVLLLGGVLLIVVIALVVLQSTFNQSAQGLSDLDLKKCKAAALSSLSCSTAGVFQPGNLFSSFEVPTGTLCDCSNFVPNRQADEQAEFSNDASLLYFADAVPPTANPRLTWLKLGRYGTDLKLTLTHVFIGLASPYAGPLKIVLPIRKEFVASVFPKPDLFESADGGLTILTWNTFRLKRGQRFTVLVDLKSVSFSDAKREIGSKIPTITAAKPAGLPEGFDEYVYPGPVQSSQACLPDGESCANPLGPACCSNNCDVVAGFKCKPAFGSTPTLNPSPTFVPSVGPIPSVTPSPIAPQPTTRPLPTTIPSPSLDPLPSVFPNPTTVPSLSPTPTVIPLPSVTPTVTPVCGDGFCARSETSQTCPKDCAPIATPSSTPPARICPQYAPPAPGWCADGTVTPGKIDPQTGCQGPPQCVRPTATPPTPTALPSPTSSPVPSFDTLVFSTGRGILSNLDDDRKTGGSYVFVQSSLDAPFDFGTVKARSFYYVTSSASAGKVVQGMIFYRDPTTANFVPYVHSNAIRASDGRIKTNFVSYSFGGQRVDIRFNADGIELGTNDPDFEDFVVFVPDGPGGPAFQIDVGYGDQSPRLGSPTKTGVAYE